MSACSSDESLEHKPVSESLIVRTKNFLNGDIVLGTHTTLNGEDKTLLPGGCPTKYNFSWEDNDPNHFTIQLCNFHVGTMPLTVNFACKVAVIERNSWERKEYVGDSWIKFKGADGKLLVDEQGKKTETVNGSIVEGFYNADTHEIIFIVNYNMMNVRSECYLQKIDKNRINNFESEFAQYEKDLQEEKKRRGL